MEEEEQAKLGWWKSQIGIGVQTESGQRLHSSHTQGCPSKTVGLWVGHLVIQFVGKEKWVSIYLSIYLSYLSI